MTDFRETLYTIDSKGKRKWVYPTFVFGKFRKLRFVVAAFLLLFYLCLPWLSIAGDQAVFLDIANRRFIFFGVTFWATDTFFLFLTLASLAISLFFFTAIFGRIWCGWACPETVFLEFVFRPLEKLIEGSPAERLRLDRSPWNFKKIRIKLTKYLCFAILAWILASTFLAYFIGRDTLLTMMVDYPWHNLSTFLLTLAMMVVVLFQFGWFREQFCTVLCPYARFQSVLLDDSSLLVGYDTKRGEPRGKISAANGDCIDCGLCVRVCPTGIDIRNGLQLECIQCAACADACDSIMNKIGKPLGLVRYDTERGLLGQKVKYLRPRVLVYAGILFLMVSFFAYSLGTRELSEVSIFHSSSGELFKELDSGELVNQLQLHIQNKDSKTHKYSLASPDKLPIKFILPVDPFPVPSSSYQRVPLFAQFDRSLLTNGRKKIAIIITSEDGFEKRLEFELLGPG